MRIATSLRSYQISRFVHVIFCHIHFFMSNYDLGMPLPEAPAFRFRRCSVHRTLPRRASSLAMTRLVRFSISYCYAPYNRPFYTCRFLSVSASCNVSVSRTAHMPGGNALTLTNRTKSDQRFHHFGERSVVPSARIRNRRETCAGGQGALPLWLSLGIQKPVSFPQKNGGFESGLRLRYGYF